MCDKSHMVDIRCRSVKYHFAPKETGLDVECSLERGLYCESRPNLPCVDFEISVLCQCSTTTIGNIDRTTGFVLRTTHVRHFGTITMLFLSQNHQLLLKLYTKSVAWTSPIKLTLQIAICSINAPLESMAMNIWNNLVDKICFTIHTH